MPPDAHRSAAEDAALPTTAIVLAAGRGERMRPLTDDCPKPLLPVHGKPLIEWHLEALARDGVRTVIINTAWLEDRFPASLGDGSRWGLTLHYSMEGRDHGHALETAGGIAKALPRLSPDGRMPFWVVSGDIWCPDWRYDAAVARRFAASDDDALLWLVPNPGFKTQGDFAMDPAGRLTRPSDVAARAWTYANLALLRPRLCADVPHGQPAALGPLLFDAAARGRLAGAALQGRWENVGTPAQLAALQAH